MALWAESNVSVVTMSGSRSRRLRTSKRARPCARSGMIVFKLDRERPAYAAHGGTLYYVKERYLRAYDYQSQRDNPLISIRRTSTAGAARPRRTWHVRCLARRWMYTSAAWPRSWAAHAQRIALPPHSWRATLSCAHLLPVGCLMRLALADCGLHGPGQAACRQRRAAQPWWGRRVGQAATRARAR